MDFWERNVYLSGTRKSDGNIAPPLARFVGQRASIEQAIRGKLLGPALLSFRGSFGEFIVIHKVSDYHIAKPDFSRDAAGNPDHHNIRWSPAFNHPDGADRRFVIPHAEQHDHYRLI